MVVDVLREGIVGGDVGRVVVIDVRLSVAVAAGIEWVLMGVWLWPSLTDAYFGGS